MAFIPFTEEDRPTMAAFNEKFQQAIQEAVTLAPNVAIGSYVGTGKYGSSNPNTLNFSFKPKILCISSSSAAVCVALNGETSNGIVTRSPMGTGEIQNHVVTFSVSENSISWFSNSTTGGDGVVQLNKLGMTYNYTAIG